MHALELDGDVFFKTRFYLRTRQFDMQFAKPKHPTPLPVKTIVFGMIL